MSRCLIVRRLGLVSYAEGLELQRQLVAERQADAIDDTLLLLQHPHVLTLGVKADKSRQHVLATPERLAELGVTLHETGRGGDVTYHGPGQIVGYPIFNLKPDRCDVHQYVRDLEEVMIRVSGSYGFTAARIPGLTGAWVGAEKIGAIGVRIQRWVTSHGFAFNVNTDLEFFKLIVPCGLTDRGVTSLAKLAGREIAMTEVEDRVVQHVCEIFGRVTEGDRRGQTEAHVDTPGDCRERPSCCNHAHLVRQRGVDGAVPAGSIAQRPQRRAGVRR